LSYDNLKNYLIQNGDAVAKKAAEKKDSTRDELVSAAQSAYSSASTAGGSEFASATNYIASVTAAAKQNTFATWSESDLKAYLDSYGIPVPQGSKLDDLRALARKESTYFRYGTSSPGGTLFAKARDAVEGGWNWVASQLRLGSDAAQQELSEAEDKANTQAKRVREDL
jgi:hypothetical protein